MALGTMTSNNAAAAGGPVFFDDVSIVGGAYVALGFTGVRAKLQALRKDSRSPVAGECYASGGYFARYDAVGDKLTVYEEADAGGEMVEVSGGTDLSAITFKLHIQSK